MVVRGESGIRVSGLVALCLFASPALAGDPTPPAGPVAGTMKTLDEVEPRIPLNLETAPSFGTIYHHITQPGSYYLTGDIVIPEGKTVGVSIDAENVTLDLNGYTIYGFLSSDVLIADGAGADEALTIRNGILDNQGNNFAAIELNFTDVAVLEDLLIHDGDQYGLRLNTNATMESCVVQQTGYIGVWLQPSASLTMRNCLVQNTGDRAIYGSDNNTLVIEDSVVRGAGQDGISGLGAASVRLRNVTIESPVEDGISFDTANVLIEDCSVVSAGTYGIEVAGGQVRDCRVTTANYIGIYMNGPGVVRDCAIDMYGVYGMYLGSFATVVGNTIHHSEPVDFAIYVSGTGVKVEGNTIQHEFYLPNTGIYQGFGADVSIIRNMLVNCDLTLTGALNGLIGPGNDLTSPWTNFIR